MVAESNDTIKTDLKEIICVICPNSCKLQVFKDEKGEIHVEEYGCARGIQYGKDEYTAPKRTLITTVKIQNGVFYLFYRSVLRKQFPKSFYSRLWRSQIMSLLKLQLRWGI